MTPKQQAIELYKLDWRERAERLAEVPVETRWMVRQYVQNLAKSAQLKQARINGRKLTERVSK